MAIANKLRAAGTALGIAALALLGNGCGEDRAYQEERARIKEVHYRQDARDRIQDDINKITGCQLFNGRRIHYNEFIETTGLARTLGKEYNDFTVHVDVVSNEKLRDLDKNWQLQPSIQDPNTNEARYVNVYVDSEGGWSILGKLEQKQNEYNGVKPLPSDVVGGYP